MTRTGSNVIIRLQYTKNRRKGRREIMNARIGQELKKWRDSLDAQELNPYDVTVVNVILDSFDELQDAGGVAGGKRVTKFAQLVNEKKGICDATLHELLVFNASSEKRIKRINTLEVESFRGFATSRKFELGKQYVLLYGPNGSGKTSFSEALEYGLLGSIEEADADNIKLATYIKNTSTKKGIPPVIYCLFEDGSEGVATAAYETYRFSFVEKNRIADFSHISGLTAKSQSERIAALFGLSEFTTFVQGFTKGIDDKYLPGSSITEKNFKEQQAVRNAKQAELAELQEDLNNLSEMAQQEIIELAKKDSSIKTIQQALNYYDDAKTGLLTIKLQDKDKSTIKVVDYQRYNEIKSCCKEIQKCIDTIIAKRENLANKALEVNYKQLFEIISNLDETNECPACGTPISAVVRNPYLHAKSKLREYKEIDEIKQIIHGNACECKKLIDELASLVEKNMDLVEVLGVKFENLNKVAGTDVEKVEDAVKQWQVFSRNVISLLDEEVAKKLSEYNDIAKKKNDAYMKEIEEIRGKEKALVQLSTKLSEKEKLVKEGKSFIEEFDKNSENTLLKIKIEKAQADFNLKIAEAYKKVIDNLDVYVENLPTSIAKDLEEKIVDYYNTINIGDADFEMLSDISLPTGSSNKLILVFKDGSTSDALQVLSEGHVKILGLSMLLAKAVKDSANFIIFDDIVNAIDDEHRNGVANLLMTHDDFRDVQIILSTHGDQFITKLKDRLGATKADRDSVTYKFLPADSLQERGVLVEYSDARTPIEAAKNKYQNNELKDAATKSRQAMESISYNLWNKLSRAANGQIRIALRSPKAQPDLYAIVEALINKTKKISGMEQITENLEAIKKQDNWRVLNKGTHFEDEQPEFDRVDVKNVLEILDQLDNQVRELKIQETAQCTNSTE